MKRVTRYELSNGALYADFETAQRVADNRYGTVLCKLAHSAPISGKYSDNLKWIEANLATFVELLALKADIELEASQADEQDD